MAAKGMHGGEGAEGHGRIPGNRLPNGLVEHAPSAGQLYGAK